MIEYVLENAFTFAQIFGLLGFFIQVLAWQIKNPRLIIFLNVPVNITWAIQFYLLGAFVGCFQSIVCLFKELFLSLGKAKYIPYVVFSYITACLIVMICFFNVWYDTLPFIGTFVVNLALIQRDNRALFARATIICTLCWLSYSYFTAAYVTMACDIIVVCAILIGMARIEKWNIGRCYRTFLPSIRRSLFNLTPKTYP